MRSRLSNKKVVSAKVELHAQITTCVKPQVLTVNGGGICFQRVDEWLARWMLACELYETPGHLMSQ